MTRGAEKTETESVLVEFETKVLPEETFFGFMKYRVREFIPKPMRCFNCQEFEHVAKVCKGGGDVLDVVENMNMGIVKRERNQSAVIVEGITVLLIGVVK